jgi:hypothetical protein
LNYQSGTNDARNVLHFVKTAGGNFSGSDVIALGTELAAWWNARLKSLQPNTLMLESIQVQALHVEPGIPVETAVGTIGTSPGSIAPGNVTMCVTLRSSTGGRSGRGRIYHVGLETRMYVGDIINTTFHPLLQTAYQHLRTLNASGNTSAYQLAVVSRFSNNEQRAEGVAYPVTNVTADNIIDSQRRRLTGRGR